MRLDYIKQSGFFHFGARDIDVAALPQGIIAIVGPNGGGKTSLIEGAMAGTYYGPGELLKSFPSRDVPLASCATARDAYLVTQWTLDGTRYQLRVNVDGDARKVDATIHEIQSDGRLVPLNDGKVTTFAKVIEDLFPSRRSVLASAFSSQGRKGGFGDLDQKGRMALFVELADLAHYETLADTAHRCQLTAEDAVKRLDAQLDAIERDASQVTLDALSKRLADLAAAADADASALDALCINLASLEIRLTQQSADTARHTLAQQRLREVLTTLSRLSLHKLDLDKRFDALAKAREQGHQQAKQRYHDDLAAARTRRTAARAVYETVTKDRAERVANNQALLDGGQEIRDAAELMPGLEEGAARLQSELSALETKRDALQQERSTTATAFAQLDAANWKLHDAEQRAGLLTQVKFGEVCGDPPACPLVTDAVTARKSVVQLRAQVEEANVLRTVMDGLDKRAAGVVENIRTTRAALTAASETIKSVRLLAQRVVHLDNARTRISELLDEQQAADDAEQQAQQAIAREVEALEVRLATELRSIDTSSEAALKDLGDAQTAHASDVASAGREKTSAEAEVAATSDAERQRAETERALTGHREGIRSRELNSERLKIEHKHTAERIDTLTRDLAQADALASRMRIAQDEGLAWATLAKACGRDGLQRLEIDAAGPVASDIANQLLRVGYGTRFSVDVVTQVATADGSGQKERFTVLALDNEHDGEARDVSLLSGGERVIVEEAIRAALSVYVNMRSRHRFSTLVRDETTGALDPEHALAYVAMLRKLVELSGAERCLFVTHVPSCAALADAQIRLNDGTPTVVLRALRGGGVMREELERVARELRDAWRDSGACASFNIPPMGNMAECHACHRDETFHQLLRWADKIDLLAKDAEMKVRIVLDVNEQERFVIAKYFAVAATTDVDKQRLRATRKQVRRYVVASLKASVRDRAMNLRGRSRAAATRLADPNPPSVEPLPPEHEATLELPWS